MGRPDYSSLPAPSLPAYLSRSGVRGDQPRRTGLSRSLTGALTDVGGVPLSTQLGYSSLEIRLPVSVYEFYRHRHQTFTGGWLGEGPASACDFTLWAGLVLQMWR